MSEALEREWTLWSDQRPPNAPGEYRYRVLADILGLQVQPEWTEKMTLCGMGYGESEYWPLSPCCWNGYSRYITHAGLEWSPVQVGDGEGVFWGGIELAPCPFTGNPANLRTHGSYIGAPLWRSEAFWLGSAGVPARRWTDGKAMLAFWNHRIEHKAKVQTDVQTG